MEDTGGYRSYGSSGHDGYACPNEPSKSPLHSDAEVKIHNRYLRYHYTDVIDDLAKVVYLWFTLA